MKTKKEFMLRNVAGEYMVVPTGKASVHFNGVITLNESGKLLYEKLEKGCEKDALVSLLVETYEIDTQTAKKDVNSFLETLRKKDVLDEHA